MSAGDRSADGKGFVSGLPGMTVEQVCAPEGIEMLRRLRVRARNEAAALAPACVERFNGSERIAADDASVEAKRDYDALVTLIDGINGDMVMMLRASTILARGKFA